jgi:chromosome segregation ATPase
MMNTTSVSSQPEKASRFSAPVIAGLVLGVALIGSNVYFASRTSQLEEQIKGLRTAVKQELVSLQQDTKSVSEQQERTFAELQKQIQTTESKSQQAAMQAGANARRFSEQIARKISDQQQNQLAQANQQLQEQLNSKIGEVKEVATATNAQVTGIASEVTNVKSEVASTKSELERTIQDLRSVRGDLGIQSGLIATNAKELAALRAIGERNYIEFELPKTKAPQRIGDVAVQLKKFDPKRNRYTIELVADDKKVEKKDRTVNEPVQFYLASARTPYEIVVNEVRRDSIVGYLSAPKVKQARN